MSTEPALKPQESPAPERRPAATTARRRLIADRAAKWVVTGGGMAIIASILGILFFIVIEIVPMFGGADVRADRSLDLGSIEVTSLVTDEHRSHVALLTVDGRLLVVRLDDGSQVLDRPLLPAVAEGETIDATAPTIVAAAVAPGEQLLTAATSDGRIVATRIEWVVSFDEDRRVVKADISDPVIFPMDPEGRPLAVRATLCVVLPVAA